MFNVLGIFFSGIEMLFKAGCPHGVIVKAMDCGIVVSEFVLQSRYYVSLSGKKPLGNV